MRTPVRRRRAGLEEPWHTPSVVGLSISPSSPAVLPLRERCSCGELCGGSHGGGKGGTGVSRVSAARCKTASAPARFHSSVQVVSGNGGRSDADLSTMS